MSNNEYSSRPWHLPEYTHVTNWATRQMARTIQRRDPTRPGFWYLSYSHPHPPLAPLQCYLDMYRESKSTSRFIGDWARDESTLPYWLRAGSRLTPTFQRCQAPRRAPRFLCALHAHRSSIARRDRHAARRRICWTTPSSCSRPITAICWAIMGCGPSACSTKTRPTSR